MEIWLPSKNGNLYENIHLPTALNQFAPLVGDTSHTICRGRGLSGGKAPVLGIPALNYPFLSLIGWFPAESIFIGRVGCEGRQISAGRVNQIRVLGLEGHNLSKRNLDQLISSVCSHRSSLRELL